VKKGVFLDAWQTMLEYYDKKVGIAWKWQALGVVNPSSQLNPLTRRTEGRTKWYYLKILDLQVSCTGPISTLSGIKFPKVPREDQQGAGGHH